MRRFLGIALSAALLVGLAAAIWVSVSEQIGEFNRVEVRGLIGSEKEAFFHDPRVIEALAGHGLDVRVQKAGSREIATSFELKQYDFAFPAGVPAAEKIKREQGASKAYTPFFTPMAVASWKPIAELLVNAGLATDQGGYYSLDLKALVAAVEAGRRWNELPDNQAYPVNKSLLITSTDVRKSNSAAMYLALASFVANGDRVAQNEADVQRVLPLMKALFLRQGFVESSSAGPFNDYLVMGMGKAPLVMVYEAQFLYSAATDRSIRPEMVLMYPAPTVFTKHILIPFSEAGQRLGEALESDPELQRLAVEHGLRTADLGSFRALVERSGVKVPEQLVNVVEPPSYEILEHMIQLIESSYGGGTQ